jgi:hypothetical protein
MGPSDRRGLGSRDGQRRLGLRSLEFDDYFQILGVLGYSRNPSMKWKSLDIPRKTLPRHQVTKTHQMMEIFVPRWRHVLLGEDVKLKSEAHRASKLLERWQVGAKLETGGSTSRAKNPPKSIAIGQIVLAYSHDRTHSGWQLYCMWLETSHDLTCCQRVSLFRRTAGH